MSDLLRREDFKPHLNQDFQLELEGRQIKLRLTEVNKGSERIAAQYGEDERPPFSLVFLGPSDQPLPQRLYNMKHPHMGDLQIFLVPIGPGKEGMLYEAVFG